MAHISPPEVARPSLFWYYLDYLNPLYLLNLYNHASKYLWKGVPQVDSKAIQMDDVDEQGRFVKSKEVVQLRIEGPPLPDCNFVFNNIRFSPSLLRSEEMLRRLLGNTPKTTMTKSALQVFCEKDQNFLNTSVFYAHRKCSPLYQMLCETYLNDYGEEPHDIIYQPDRIEAEDKADGIWINCSYSGNIVTKQGKSIPFNAECSYNLMNPVFACRSIFINPKREVV